MITAEEKFNRLAAQWEEGTRFLSSPTQIAAHPAYQEIIGMGHSAVVFMLRRLAAGEPEHWFMALHAITKTDPVPSADRGRITRMAEHWVAWGRDRNIIP